MELSLSDDIFQINSRQLDRLIRKVHFVNRNENVR
jgi:hypothetical protein